MDRLVSMLRAAGDPTRLRLLLLLRQAELTVSELIEIVGQSQPRVSRHLKLLGEAGLVERFKEGSWVFCRAADRGVGSELGRAIAQLADPALQESDRGRLAHVREARAQAAAAYFKDNAAEWERIRALHAPEREVEDAIMRQLSAGPINDLLDAGTGTGRMLELLGNRAARAGGGLFVGGARGTSMVAVVSSTLWGNRAPDGANLGQGASPSVTTLHATILDNPVGASNCSIPVGQPVKSSGYNFSSDGSCGLLSTGDVENADPHLGLLADNGGPTLTHLPQRASPVVDAGGTACTGTDQRGIARPEGEACDIGAVEGAGAAAGLAAAGLAAVSTSVDPLYRQRFFEPLISDVAVSLAGRDSYLSMQREESNP